MNKLTDKGIELGELVETDSKKVELIWYKLFDAFAKERKPNADAIADMALDNFIEMRDRVGDPKFLLAKKVEKVLEKKFPSKYVSRYSLVTFTNIPYKLAQDAGVICNEILDKLCSDLDEPESVDLKMAEELIESKLSPVLSKASGLAAPSTSSR